MTGSESPNGSASRGGRRPKQQKQQQQRDREDSSKPDVMAPTDQLRRLAIKNSYGNKSLPPSSLLLCRAISSSTSSLHQLEPLTASAEPKPDDAAGEDGKLSSQTKEQTRPNPKNGKCAQYITRQELLHSLRRTTSNHSVGMMQTICSGNTSYIHHTPRHLTRTHFNPKASLARSTTTTPDSGLWSSDGASLSGDKVFERLDDCSQETQSLVNVMPSIRLSPIMSPKRSKHRQRSPVYVGVELTDSHSGKYQLAPQRYEEGPLSSQEGSYVIRNFVSLAGHGSHMPGLSPSNGKNPLHHPQNYTRCDLHVGQPPQGVYNISAGLPGVCTSPSTSLWTSPSRSSSVSPGQVTMTVDKKIKLHIPRGRKTASLV